MRSRAGMPAILLSFLALAGGCGPESPVEPVAFEPALSVNAAGGAMVVRGSTLSFLVHFDAERGLLSLHAPSTVCGAGSLNVDDFQFVTTPSAIGQFIALLRSGSEQVAVYRAGSLADAGIVGTAETAGIGGIVNFGAFCAFIAGPTRIAEGTVRRVSVLSNASFSATWTGTIDAVSGGTVKLTELYQLGADAQDPSNPATFVVHVSKILLN